MVTLCLGWILLWPFATAVSGDTIIAKAHGPQGLITITADRLQRYADAHPDRTPRSLAQDLIDFELLAAVGHAKGFATDLTVLEETKAALVRVYLKRHFEIEWQANRLPEAQVRASYTRNRSFFVRPEVVQASHIIVTDGGNLPKGEKSTVAHALAAEIHASLVANPPTDAADFRSRAEAFKPAGEAVKLQVRAEVLGRFAKQSAMDKDFVQQVFALDTPGTMTPLFSTAFGWHTARLERKDPAKNVTFEQAEADLRKKIEPEIRTLKLRELAIELGDQQGALINPELLDQQGL